jgi:transcriptional regulator with XRE-family HTH domain
MEEASRMMAEQDISRSDLAARMGVTRARVTQLFNAPPNLTLRSIAQLALALRSTPHASLFPTCPSAVNGFSMSSILPAGAADAHSLAPNATAGRGTRRPASGREAPDGGKGLGGSRRS